MWMFIGNQVADTLAGVAASLVRVSQDTRTRIGKVEIEAGLVRKRLLRSTLEAMAASPSVPRARDQVKAPRPPAPSIVSVFESAHTLSESGRACVVCRSSASAAAATAWRRSQCYNLQSVDSALFQVPRGQS
eukprot:2049104-Pyramimonas_sp.AAC.1